LQDKIKGIYSRLKEIFSKRDEKVAFSELTSMDSEERLLTFVSLLHLDNQQKVWLEQEGHFEEIWILLKEMYEAKNKDLLERLKKEMEMLEEEQVIESQIDKDSSK
jgi:chromatin segregation and condensation protein Rec8/ScpA/Scc1 (kleisin family)